MKPFVARRISDLKTWIQKRKLLTFFLVVFGFFIGWQLALQPLQERDWRDENFFPPVVIQKEESFTIESFRDFYTDEKGESVEVLKDATFYADQLEEVSLGLSHFAEFEGAAHTFLHFRFTDGKNFSFSVEARLEKGEKYSPYKGLIRQAELYIAAGSDRDILGRRAGIKNERLFLYPLDLSPEQEKKVLNLALAEINAIAKTPKFYNTLTRNCTTEVVGILEEVLDKNIIWTYSHLLPGYFDEKLFDMGLLKNPKNENDFITFKNAHRVENFTTVEALPFIHPSE
jgi:hypothetical protein